MLHKAVIYKMGDESKRLGMINGVKLIFACFSPSSVLARLFFSCRQFKKNEECA
jgi:hypothetical protein